MLQMYKQQASVGEVNLTQGPEAAKVSEHQEHSKVLLVSLEERKKAPRGWACVFLSMVHYWPVCSRGKTETLIQSDFQAVLLCIPCEHVSEGHPVNF